MEDRQTAVSQDEHDVTVRASDQAQPDALLPQGDPTDLLAAAVMRLRQGLAALSVTSRYTRDELDTIYALGWSHLSQQQPDTALRFFLFLTDYAPTDESYLMGLGVCLQRLDRPRDALAVFSWVGTLEQKSVESSLRSAECLLALRERAEAEQLLDLIVADSLESSRQPTHVAYRAQALLDVLRRGIDASGVVEGAAQTMQNDGRRPGR